MLFKNRAFYLLILHLSVSIVISAGGSEIPSKGKSNPVHHRHFDERKISKRHNEPDFQTCLDNFEIHQDKIIRTQDSRAMGARYINERDVPSREDCLRLCCETADCDVFVFEERSPGSCYLFQCGTPEEFKCKFTKHKNYTSAILASNRHMTELESQIKLTKHEHELTNLRQTDSSSTAIIPSSKTEAPSQADNKESEQLIPSSPNNNSINNNRHCSRYQFECRSSEECIAIYNACDGIPQCSDGSDEAPELGCPALLTTIPPVESGNQGEIPESISLRKVIDSSLHPQTKNEPIYQSVSIENEHQTRHGNEYNNDPWLQQPPGYKPNDQFQHHHHHQELQIGQQKQMQDHEQQKVRPQEFQQQHLLHENQQQHQQKLHQPIPHQQQEAIQELPQTQSLQQQQQQQQMLTANNYIQQTNNGNPSQQQMLTMSSMLPQQQQQTMQLQQTQTQQTLQHPLQQNQQLENIQPPQQLINQAKLFGREGEALLYHSASGTDSLHWMPSGSNNNNNYQQEQAQENLPYHLQNNGMSQIFNHKGNSLVSQSERAGNQFADTLPNEYNHYNYFDNNQYRMLPPHGQQNTWQNIYKPMHDLSPIDDAIGGPREGESGIQSGGLNGLGPDYYYEENMRNKLQQQLLAQQRKMPQSNNMPLGNGEQLLQTQYKDMKSPLHEEITLDHVNHDSTSTGQGTSVKKASPAQHVMSSIITTAKPKELKTHHYGHNSHRKMEQLTAEVTLKETTFDGVTMDQTGSPSGAILSLTLGMCVTAIMIVLVGCRMRTVRRRMRRGGKSAYAHDADFLVNGMYL